MTLIEVAKKLIREYLSINPKHSITSLARIAGVAPSTARAIMQGDIQVTADDKLASLLLTFMTIDEVMQIFEEYAGKSVWLSMDKTRRAETKNVSFENGHDWEFPDHLIIGLASLDDGVSLSNLRQKFGEIGTKRTEILLESGILQEINNRIKLRSDLHFIDYKDSVQKIRLHSQYWVVNETETGGFIHHQTRGLTYTGQSLVIDATRNYLKEVSDIEAKNRGSDCAMVLSIVGSFLEEDH